MKISGHPPRIACFLMIGACNARSAGVAVLKEQIYHRDVAATAVAYTRIIDSHGPYLRIVSGRTNVDIQRSKLVAQIEVADSIPATITAEKDITAMREMLGNLQEFSAHYVQSEKLLKPQIAALTAHIRRFDAGEVRFEGNWISRSELAGILKTRQRKWDATELTEVENRVFYASQRDKGLLLYEGKWMTPQQAKLVPPQAPTELSESIESLWNGDLEGARIAVEFLGNLASRQTGEPKVRTERLMTVVKNLFTAEERFIQQRIASTRESYDASIQDKNAKKWLKPNGFGTTHIDVARQSHEKAAEIRQRAADKLEQCKGELRTQISESGIVAADFLKIRENRVAMILETATRVVKSRHFTEIEIQPHLAEDSNPTSLGD